ncbi:MAG TPA: hypothetical protein PKM88_00980 [bacterium]|nr:hypothetical protein [bacterium]
MVTKLALDKVQVGMKLGRPLYRNFLILMHEHQQLSERHIERLRNWKIDYVYVTV